MSRVRVSEDGGYSADGNIYILKEGNPAELYFYNYPENTYLYFEFDIISAELTTNVTNVAKLQFESLTGDGYKITDDNGNASLKIGATLKTNGAGGSYADTTYSGYFRVNIIFY